MISYTVANQRILLVKGRDKTGNAIYIQALMYVDIVYLSYFDSGYKIRKSGFSIFYMALSLDLKCSAEFPK